MKHVVPSLLMLAQGLPFASRLLPFLAHEHIPPRADWESEYANGRWSYLAGLKELAHYSIIVGYCASLKPGGRVLDVGCGEGVLQTRLSPQDCRRYLGIDFAAESIRHVAERADAVTDFQVADVATFATDLKFDVIVFNEILYYFENPLSIIQRYQDFLDTSGIMIVSMIMKRNNISIWNAIDTAFDTQDETAVFNRDGLCWKVKVLTVKADQSSVRP